MKTLLTFLLFTQLLSANIVRKIESISYRSQVGNTIALIKLTDESVWKWVPDTYSENMLRNWKDGDEVYIHVGNHPGFALQNKTKPLYSPIVALSFNSYTLYPSLKKYITDENTIHLSDNTRWEVLYDFHKRNLVYWNIGDRIIPVKGPNDSYELINLDIPYENRSQIERSIEVGKIS